MSSHFGVSLKSLSNCYNRTLDRCFRSGRRGKGQGWPNFSASLFSPGIGGFGFRRGHFCPIAPFDCSCWLFIGRQSVLPITIQSRSFSLICTPVVSSQVWMHPLTVIYSMVSRAGVLRSAWPLSPSYLYHSRSTRSLGCPHLCSCASRNLLPSRHASVNFSSLKRFDVSILLLFLFRDHTARTFLVP